MNYIDENTNKAIKTAYNALEDKKGINTKVIDISEISSVADFFIISSGSNINQVQALADNVEVELSKAGYIEHNTEGFKGAGWILLDYKDFVIHIFNHEERNYYNIERIWGDGKNVEF